LVNRGHETLLGYEKSAFGVIVAMILDQALLGEGLSSTELWNGEVVDNCSFNCW
jgi:hypothetical protein